MTLHVLLISKFILCFCCNVMVNQEQQHFNKRQLFSGQCHQISANSFFKNPISKGQSCQSLHNATICCTLYSMLISIHTKKINPVGANPSPVSLSPAVQPLLNSLQTELLSDRIIRQDTMFVIAQLLCMLRFHNMLVFINFSSKVIYF